MPVSDQRQKMALAACETVGQTYGKIVQAVVNAAWRKFDPDDKTTWPNTEMAPSGEKWVIQAENLLKEVVFASMIFHLNTGWQYHLHYADPADIMKCDLLHVSEE